MKTVPTNSPGFTTTRGLAFQAVIVFIAVLLARVTYVSLFAVETPFWDQWDAEAFYLLKPWQEGVWSPAQLLSAHNEHRIAFTRLLSLLIFALNANQWNNLVSAYANAILAAGYLTLFFVLLAHRGAPAARNAAFVATALAGVLPFSWENFLVGFQSQFYFMALLAIVAIALGAFRKPSYLNTALITSFAVAALFTSAGGLIGAVGVMMVTVLRATQRRHLGRIDALTIALMVGTIVAGFLLTPSLSDHANLVAVGPRDHATAIITALMWPVEPQPASHFRFPFKIIAAAAIWTPSIACAWQAGSGRRVSETCVFALGVSAWAGAQAIAIAHSRGHGMVVLPSRYTDIPAIAIVANAWLAWEWASAKTRAYSDLTARLPLACALFFVVVVGFGIYTRWPEDIAKLRERTYLTARETANVSAYMRTGDAAWLHRPLLEIPYPDADRLKMMLDDPTIAAMLPPSLQRRTSGDRIGPLTYAAERTQEAIRNIARNVLPGLSSLEPDSDIHQGDAPRTTRNR